MTGVFVIVIGLIYGSFLNVVAWRLVHDRPFFAPRSRCTSCNAVIAWYDNIPVISFLFLRGRCRRCAMQISVLYPFIELCTALIIYLLWVSGKNSGELVSYGIFASAAIVAMRTDIELLVIPQLCTLWLVPVGWLCAYCGMLPVGFMESILGSMLGFGVLWGVRFAYRKLKGFDGLGIGDAELLAMIGAFLGPMGAWLALTVGSCIGALLGGLYLHYSKKMSNTLLPFGPFLIAGAFAVIIWSSVSMEYSQSPDTVELDEASSRFCSK